MQAKADQVDHYNEFGRLYRDAIISSSNPDVWTTDPEPSSLMNRQMRERIIMQEEVVKKYFNTTFPVLDLGCGFGRQSFMMARNGFKVTGVDSSNVLIEIAQELVNKNGYDSQFLCDSVWNFNSGKKYKQVTLFDVVEHFKPADRKIFMKHLAEHICEPKSLVIITIPYMSRTRVKDFMTNTFKSFAQHFESLSAHKEHPYPIPYKDIFEALLPPYFTLKEYLHNDDTAFFVLERV